jgi:hypothetical protein
MKDENNIINDLDWDIQPERDLWPDIKSNIRFSGNPEVIDSGSAPIASVDNAASTLSAKRLPWVPMSIAACLMLAFGAFFMSTLSLQKAQQTYDLQANYIEYQKSQISLIEQQHQQVRAQFTALLSGEIGNLNPSSVAEVTAVLMTIDDASIELKKAILAQPMNANYSSMLARTYQQELKLLNKFKTANGLSI